jgi:hypothetical protein
VNPPSPKLLKEEPNNSEMRTPTLNTGGKKVLSCVIIRKRYVCIAPSLSTVYQVRVATSTISTLATSIMKTIPQLSDAVSKESEYPMTCPPIMKAPPSQKAVRKRKPSPIIKYSPHSTGVLKNLHPEDNPSHCGCNKKVRGSILLGCSALVMTSSFIARTKILVHQSLHSTQQSRHLFGLAQM